MHDYSQLVLTTIALLYDLNKLYVEINFQLQHKIAKLLGIYHFQIATDKLNCPLKNNFKCR